MMHDNFDVMPMEELHQKSLTPETSPFGCMQMGNFIMACPYCIGYFEKLYPEIYHQKILICIKMCGYELYSIFTPIFVSKIVCDHTYHTALGIEGGTTHQNICHNRKFFVKFQRLSSIRNLPF